MELDGTTIATAVTVLTAVGGGLVGFGRWLAGVINRMQQDSADARNAASADAEKARVTFTASLKETTTYHLDTVKAVVDDQRQAIEKLGEAHKAAVEKISEECRGREDRLFNAVEKAINGKSGKDVAA